MIDLTKVRNYYVACGYTDLRLGIDGLAAVVTQQYGSRLMKRVCSCSVDGGQTESRRYTGQETVIFFCTNVCPTEDSSGRGQRRS